MKETTRQNLMVLVLVLLIMLVCFSTLLIMSYYIKLPYEQCIGKSDNFIINAYGHNMTCLELRTVNETISSNEYG